MQEWAVITQPSLNELREQIGRARGVASELRNGADELEREASRWEGFIMNVPLFSVGELPTA